MVSTEEVGLTRDTEVPGGPEEVVTVIGEDGAADPSTDPGLSPEVILAIYEAMVRARRLDQALEPLAREGSIGVHLGAGFAEAAVVGAASALDPSDLLYVTARDAAALLYRGLTLEDYLRQVFATASDPARGRRMPGLVARRAVRAISTSALVGRHLPHATGTGWAARIRGEAITAAAFFGARAVDTQDFHAALNFAGVFRTQTLFLCRNGDPCRSVAEMGVGYGVRSVRCDGGDALATHRVVRDAARRARTGEGPCLVELIVRWSHRDPEEDDRDPLVRLRKHLLARGLWDDGRDAALVESVTSAIREGIAVAQSLPAPGPEDLVMDVYGELPWHLAEQEGALAKG